MKPLQGVTCLFSGMLVILAAIVLSNGLHRDAYAQEVAQLQSKPQTDTVEMMECEQGTDGCATWTFQGPQGIGQWPNGEIASLTYKKLNGNTVHFHRAHSMPGPLRGLEVDYTGAPDKDGISGTFEYSWNGQKKSGHWYAYAMDPTKVSPPSVMHLCLAHCQTWTLDKGAPFDKPHYGSVASGGIVIVESWTRESVVMKRTDYGQVPGRATLTGRLSSDGNSIVDGNIAWTWHPCCGTTTTGRFIAAWGSAINTVPGVDGGTVGSVQVCDLACAIKAGNTILDGLELLDRLSRLTSNR